MMNKPTRKIAESLIYEMVDGNPIYYHGYRDVLKGRKDVEAILGSTYLQSLMVANLVAQLVKNLAGEYVILTNELGVLLSKNHWRIADIAIVSREALKKQGNENGYLTVPPQAVIEIDTKAALEDIEPALHSIGPYQGHFFAAEKKGYAGVGLYSRKKPKNIKRGFGIAEFDSGFSSNPGNRALAAVADTTTMQTPALDEI